MTDFKQLCAELIEDLALWLEYDGPPSRLPEEEDESCQLLKRARTALAEPEPEGPTDEELDELAWNWYSKTGSTWYQIDAFRAYARAVLARWGQ